AGKSTLMKCLFGIYREDSGEIVLKGRKVKFHSAKNALEAGVSMIHQELSNVPERTVSENIWLGREPVRRIGPLGFLDHAKMSRDTAILMKNLDMDIDPGERIGGLSISKQQACEIAKAVSYDASVVVMDEPSSSLTETETAHLFKIIRDLTAKGVAVIYISHKMSEIFQIADEVTIMRDGKTVGSYQTSELDENRLISLMVGRDNTHRFPPIESVPGELRLEVRGLSSANPRSFKDVSFELRRGEILGIGGLVGAQRTELVESLFGLRPTLAGEVLIDGSPVKICSPRDAIAKGVALITEDRRGSGIFPLMSITLNTAVASLKSYRNALRLLEHARIEEESRKLNETLRTKTPSMSTQIQNLSGGNQQKVLVSRWLMTLPEILIMDEPTRGIDVGAKYEIYTIMAELARNGKSIIMVSSEMPELIGMSHRVMVLCAGRHTGTLAKAEASQENIMRLATQFE
ncbi:MAG: sugar ABC transporter ATP-binding protein, partial [Spirochaetaceae bacterium]|nr:sugar ABC transporter ATP-binding protein [Spirochaetaceae bacterium]